MHLSSVRLPLSAYLLKIFGGPKIWGDQGLLVALAKNGAITLQTKIYVPSNSCIAHTPFTSI
jgi:hypothetical protein